jgi:hypothetical protein
MNLGTYDYVVLAVAIAVAYALLVGAKELTHEIRRRLRRRAVRAEMDAVSRRETRVREALRTGPRSAEVHPLPARDARVPPRDPTIGVDQVIAERRRKFLAHLDDRGLCVDDVRIESR